MKSHPLLRCLLVVVGFVCMQQVATAATLQAKVAEVESGNTLVVMNINRPLRVRLKAVAPPETRQPFSEAARDHLKALVLNKTVAIEYTHLTDGYLEARVFLNGVDVGMQMLRDGVAWYDRSLEYTLSAADREIYARCEQLARDEKRGLWQDSSAVAPWDYRAAQQTSRVQPNQPEPSFNSVRSSLIARAANRQKTLSNTDLMGGMVGPGSIAGKPTFGLIWPDGNPNDWRTFRSQLPAFSIRVPADSVKFEYPVLDGQKKIVTVTYIVGASEQAEYLLMWLQGANDQATDRSAAESSMEEFAQAMNKYFQDRKTGLHVETSKGRLVKTGGYSGKEYTLSAGSLSGIARIISKQIGDQREMFALVVFGPEGNWASGDFLNSFKIGGN